MIIAFTNEKGGVGKSTLATNTTVELNDRGYPTALIDGQRRKWPAAKRLVKFDSSMTTVTVSNVEELDQAVKMLAKKGFHIVIDWPGEMSDAVPRICNLSDIMLVPMEPAEQDLIQTADTLTLIRAFQIERDGKPDAWIVFNKTPENSIAARLYETQLEPLGIPISSKKIRRLDIYKNRCVMRDKAMNSSGAASDIREILDLHVMKHIAPLSRSANE